MKLQFDDRIIEERLLDHIYLREDSQTQGNFVAAAVINGEEILLKDGFTSKADARTWLASFGDKIDDAAIGDIVDVRS